MKLFIININSIREDSIIFEENLFITGFNRNRRFIFPL